MTFEQYIEVHHGVSKARVPLVMRLLESEGYEEIARSMTATRRQVKDRIRGLVRQQGDRNFIALASRFYRLRLLWDDVCKVHGRFAEKEDL